MKKFLLLMSSLCVSAGMNAQTFVNGANYFLMDYTTGNPTSNCTSTIAGSTGGLYFSNNNVADWGYKDNINNTEDAVMFSTVGSFIDVNDYPFYNDFFYINEDEYPAPQCEDMKSVAVASTMVGVNLSNNADAVIKITAKANVNGLKAIIDVTNSGEGGAWPTTMFNPWASPQDLTTEITLTTSYVEYTIDLTGSADWTAFTLKDKINMWGIAMYEEGTVWVQKIEIGTAPTSSTKKASNFKSFSIAPNPSEGSFVVKTENRPGTITITDMMGGVIETLNTTTAQNEYSLAVATKGMYFLNFKTTDGNIFTEKFIVQ